MQSNRDTIIEQVERTDRDQTSSTSQSFLYRDTAYKRIMKRRTTIQN